ncbi:MAG TPA: ATP-dependent helicase [Epulopiscium sp.]|nr:ATP-dependent helicase [Candidatus Epulonipiscium sp.]
MFEADVIEEFIKIRDRIIEQAYGHLNENQRKAVLTGEGPQMIIAGPGSGKTHVIMHRLHYLISYGMVYNTRKIPEGITKEDIDILKGDIHHPRSKELLNYYAIDPRSILVITFTKAAAEEMKSRFFNMKDVNGTRIKSILFGTFHSVFFRILRNAYGYHVDQVLKEDEKRQVLKKIAEELEIEYQDEQEFLDDLENEIGLIKNDLIELSYYNSMTLPSEQFRKIVSYYEQYKSQHQKIDFDDMLYDCYILLREHKNILSFWSNRYKYILIDEFQDINKVQYETIKLLSAPNNHLFIVGDDDQSIYKFRGARPEFLLHFPQDFKDSGRVTLDINYRSTRKIVDISNSVISKNVHRYPKEIRTINPKGDEPVFIQSEDSEEEALHIAEWILNWRKKGLSYRDIAVIFRTNLQARALVDIMLDLNIPFYLRDEIPNVYEHWVAKDLLAYIKLSKDIKDNESLERIINKPKRYISKGVIFEACKKGGILFENIYKTPQLQTWQVNRLEELKFHLDCMKNKKPGEAIVYIRKHIGYDDYLVEYAQYKNISVKGLKELLDEIQEAAKHYDSFEEWMYHIQNVGEEIKEGKRRIIGEVDAVTLSTMHGAKGLEFEAVCIAGAVEGVIPHNKSTSPAELEEERRLFYVGITRAKKYLAISTVKKRYEEEVKPSRFIEEMTKKPSTEEFQKGAIIVHKKYGRGKISNIDGTTAAIAFEKGIFSRKIDLKYCIDKELIYIEKDETN